MNVNSNNNANNANDATSGDAYKEHHRKKERPVVNQSTDGDDDGAASHFPQGGYGRGRGNPINSSNATHSNQSSKNTMYNKKQSSHNQKSAALKKEGGPKF
jgi:hypothetical protein